MKTQRGSRGLVLIFL